MLFIEYIHFVCVLKIWLLYENTWKGKLQVDPLEGVINEPSAAERKESSAERRHEFDGYYVDLHKWCTSKTAENEFRKHGGMAKLQHISNCYV